MWHSSFVETRLAKLLESPVFYDDIKTQAKTKRRLYDFCLQYRLDILLSTSSYLTFHYVTMLGRKIEKKSMIALKCELLLPSEIAIPNWLNS